MATKGPTELEISVLPGYKHPAKSLQSLRKDIFVITQLTTALRNYKVKRDSQHLKRAVNLIIILSNVFEPSTLEYAIYAIMPNEFWPEAATILFVLKLSEKRKDVDEDLLRFISQIRDGR